MAGRGKQETFDWTARGAPQVSGGAHVQLGLSDLHRWLTADDATAYLGLPTRKALYAAVARGQVPAHRLGLRRLRFKLDELDSLLGRLHESAGVR